MNHDPLISTMSRLSGDTLGKFMVRLAFQLTIMARNIYVAGSDTVMNPTAMRGMNELEHRVLGYALHVFNQTWIESPDAFVRKLFKHAKLHDCVFELGKAVEFCVENLL